MMARLIRVEACAECSHCHREYVNDDMASRCWCDLLNPDGTGRDWVDAASIDPDCPLPEERAWAPVGERLPEEGERVPGVARCSWAPEVNKPFVAMVYLRSGVWRWNENDVPVLLPWTITHWQTLAWLPPLPQEVTDEQ